MQAPETKQETIFKVVKINGSKFKTPQLENLKPGKDSLWNDSGDIKLTYQQTCESTLIAHFGNGFFSAFFYAYNNHGDVKITPDDVWLAILLYFSSYVNDHAQQLRKAFVSHQGKKELIVATEHQILESQWDEFFTLIIQAIRQNTDKNVTAKLESDFSTTGRIQRILSTAIVMSTYKQYFQYTRYIVQCGINQVHFGGTLEDWQKLQKKTEALSEYDVDGKLKQYVNKLLPILKLFVQTYNGNPNVQQWNRILRIQQGNQGSGSTTKFTGWLLNFFGIYEETDQVNIATIDVDFKIDNRITKVIKNVKLVGGFSSVNQSGESNSVYRPHLSMAILEQKKKD